MRQMLLRGTALLLAFLLIASPSFAYLSDIKAIPQKDIEKLTDDALTAIYFDLLIELHAIDVNHQASGFSPNEYKQFKELVRYQYYLRKELQKRQLDIPKLDF